MKKLKLNKGFTIIEVMIVLTIAGLILAIVFLAVPALQRSSRNTQRRNDVSHLLSLMSEYQSNHSGQSPTGFGAGAGQLNLANENFSILAKPTTIASGYAAPANPQLDTAYVFTNATCSNNTPATGGGSRSAIVSYYIEPFSATNPAASLQCN